MAYKGRRVKKKPVYKKPAFWIAVFAVVLILLLVGWVWKTLSDEVFTIRKPDETTIPTSQTKPEESTEPTLPPPEANPYEPIDFDADEAYDKEENWLDTTIDGTPYKLMVFTYQSALETGKTAPAVKITIHMDFGFTTEEINRLRPDFLRTQVLAIETELFADMTAEYAAEYALNQALPLSNFHPF